MAQLDGPGDSLVDRSARRREGRDGGVEDLLRGKFHAAGRHDEPVADSSSTASLKEIESEDDLFSIYIDVEKLSGIGGASNSSVYVGTSGKNEENKSPGGSYSTEGARLRHQHSNHRRYFLTCLRFSLLLLLLLSSFFDDAEASATASSSYESENWGLATAEEFEPVPRICRIILSVYEEDLRNPQWAPPGGYGMNPDWVVLRKDYEDNQEYEVLRDLIVKNPTYMLIFGGHSLGAGVVALLTLLALHNRDKLGIPRNKIRCFALAPTRCMSLNLAVRYADVINSAVLQDDFLPRTTTALEDVFKSLLCLPCLLCIMCLKDTCTLEEKMLKDPRRLYAPGRLYHIVERKPLR
ncbi:hypothetical protein PIB30_020855 [Stylosanthes scabra]|uniref:Fungal lipase-like domain-containing protein n=1 Tax=Stylosanthes scabra TaxID=79078 RepID=A0ABU6V8H4_9FABA|nr:hypothetical protein [Stylosanthes scabra]